MNKRIGIVLVLVTLVSLGLAIQAHLELRTLRSDMSDDLSGNPAPVASPAPVAPAAPAADTADVHRIQLLQRQVMALQTERQKLLSDLAIAQMALNDQGRQAPKAAALQTASTNTSRRASFEDRMAQLKRDDPARYEEMQKQREEFGKRIQTQADER